MLRIAIIDDQLSVREKMKTYFARYQESHDCSFQLSLFDNADSFLTSYRPEYDIVLMDIDMPGINGLAAARRLRRVDPKVLLMFVTNLAQYAINGYEVDAIDYILKPVDYKKFEFKITRAIRMTSAKTKKKIWIRTEDGMTSLDPDDVTYVEVQKHNLFYHTVGETYQTRGSMKQALTDFPGPQFFPSHQSYIVNLAFVEEVRNNEAVVAGDAVMISRAKKKAFIEALAIFYNS